MPDKLQVIPLRAFKDNYVWTLQNGRCAAVVDPGEAQPVLNYLAAEKLQLIAILATHHHQDHVGGIAELLQTHKVPVYGPRGEPIATLTQATTTSASLIASSRLRVTTTRVPFFLAAAWANSITFG